MQLAFRFIVGGLLVSFFAVIGDGLKPKSFAGLFGAAPSVALATLALAILVDGKDYAALEARGQFRCEAFEKGSDNKRFILPHRLTLNWGFDTVGARAMRTKDLLPTKTI